MSVQINGQYTNELTLKREEIKNFSFTYNVDITTAVFTLEIKLNKDAAAVITKNDADFDKTDIADGKVSVVIDTTPLTDDTRYYLELQALFGVNSLDKTEDIILKIQKPVIDNP